MTDTDRAAIRAFATHTLHAIARTRAGFSSSLVTGAHLDQRGHSRPAGRFIADPS